MARVQDFGIKRASQKEMFQQPAVILCKECAFLSHESARQKHELVVSVLPSYRKCYPIIFSVIMMTEPKAAFLRSRRACALASAGLSVNLRASHSKGAETWIWLRMNSHKLLIFRSIDEMGLGSRKSRFSADPANALHVDFFSGITAQESVIGVR